MGRIFLTFFTSITDEESRDYIYRVQQFCTLPEQEYLATLAEISGSGPLCNLDTLFQLCSLHTKLIRRYSLNQSTKHMAN